jgi:predicted AAA+ superfamily ATPase
MLENMLAKQKSLGKKVNELSFDDVKLRQLFENDTDSFIELHVKGFDLIFIDEAHYSKQSGRILKYIFDKTKAKIIFAGSSAIELSLQSMKYLVGRVLLFELLPFSFKEYIRATEPKLEPLLEKNFYGEEIVEQINKDLNEFMLFGGYPRVVLAKSEDEKVKVIESIYATLILKEIKDLAKLSDDYKLTSLLEKLAIQTGSIANYDELCTATGLQYKELKRILNVLEKAFIIKQIKPFFKNKNKEISKAPKIFFYDTGLRNAIMNNFSKIRADEGAIIEDYALSEILKQGLEPKYWRTKAGAEIDFIIEKKGTILPIEVKKQIKPEQTPRAIHSFIQEYKAKKAIILSMQTKNTQPKIIHGLLQQTQTIKKYL